MSFTVWQSKDTIFIIDGHHRFKVLDLLENEGYEVPKKLPCTFIDCKNKKEASKLVLTYSSIYAYVTDTGMSDFINSNGFDITELSKEINIPELDMSFFNPPDFEPAGIDERGKLDEKKKVICPNCKTEFEPS